MADSDIKPAPAVIRGEGLILRADGSVKAKFFLTGDTDLTPEQLKQLVGFDVKIEEY